MLYKVLEKIIRKKLL